jgi:hypothetical protein
MIHFSNDEVAFVGLATAYNNPDAITLAKQSTETWIAIEFSIPDHGDTLMYLDRERFCKLIDQAEGKQVEAMPYLEDWVRTKLGLSSLSEWKISFNFISQAPEAVKPAGYNVYGSQVTMAEQDVLIDAMSTACFGHDMVAVLLAALRHFSNPYAAVFGEAERKQMFDDVTAMMNLHWSRRQTGEQQRLQASIRRA